MDLRTRPRALRSRSLLAALALLLLLAAGGHAVAATSTPCTTIGNPASGQEQPVDCVTVDPRIPPQTALIPPDLQDPEARNPEWSYIAGRRTDAKPPSEITSGHECFRDVAFQDPGHGFAVGFGLDGDAPCEEADSHIQQPVIYQFLRGEWKKVSLPGDLVGPGGGYLAAVDTYERWTSTSPEAEPVIEAFAVGGTSSDTTPARYPRTEGDHEIDSGERDPAGDRALVLWLHDRDGDGVASADEWEKLPYCSTVGGNPGRCLPEGMLPLTAVAVAATAPDPDDFTRDPLYADDALVTCPGSEDADPGPERCALPSWLGVKRAEAFAFFGGATPDYPKPDPQNPGQTLHDFRAQMWMWHCLDTQSNCIGPGRDSLGHQVYDPDFGEGEGFEPMSLTDPANPRNKLNAAGNTRAWQVPPVFRIRDIDFLRGRRDFAYAVTAGCCVSDANRDLRAKGQVQVWNALSTEADKKLLPGHWWGSSYGGSLANPYLAPPADQEDDPPLVEHCFGENKPDECDLGGGPANSLKLACQHYSDTIRPALFQPTGPLPPENEPEQLRGWTRDRCRVLVEQDPAPIPNASSVGLHVPSRMPSLFSVSLAPSADETTPQLSEPLAAEAGGFAIAGADGQSSPGSEPFLGRSSYTVRAPGLNRLTGRRGTQRGNGFTEYLDGPMFALDDQVWAASSRGAAEKANAWAVGESTKTGSGVLYRIDDHGRDPDNLLGNAIEATGYSGREGTTTDLKKAPLTYPQRFVVPSPSLHAIDTTPSGGDAWAVGDDGAIMRWQDPGLLAEEAADANVGGAERSDLSDRTGYERFEHLRSARPGFLPPLPVKGPELPDGEGDFDVYNLPGADDAETYTAIAIAEEGNDGWAIGSDLQSGKQVANLARFDGRSWRPCPLSQGSPCEVFKNRNVDLRSIATVPGVSDFEAYAVGVDTTDGATVVGVYHYRGGRWSWIGSDSKELGVVRTQGEVPFPALTHGRLATNGNLLGQGPIGLKKVMASGPNDVWVVGELREKNGKGEGPIIYRKDAEGWTECTDDGTRHPAPAGPEDGPPSRCSDLGTRPDPEESILPRPDGQGTAADRIVGAGAIGGRTYVAGVRSAKDAATPGGDITGVGDAVTRFPFVMWTEPGSDATSVEGAARLRWHNEEAGGGFEPSGLFDQPRRIELAGGAPQSLVFAIGRLDDGRLDGWLIDRNNPFKPPNGQTLAVTELLDVETVKGTRMIHLSDDGSGPGWEPVYGDNLLGELLRWPATGTLTNGLVAPPVAVSALAGSILSLRGNAPLLRSRRGRWESLPSPLVNMPSRNTPGLSAVRTIAIQPDGELWGVAGKGIFRYSQSPVRDPFRAEPLPVELPFAQGVERSVYDLESVPSGAVWLAGHSDTVARRDPVSGWDTLRIKGWRPRGAALAPVHDVALRGDNAWPLCGGSEDREAGESERAPNPDCEPDVDRNADGEVNDVDRAIGAASSTALHATDEDGFAVGGGGRVAALDARGATFDSRATELARGADLLGVDVAPDGSAVAAGEDATVLYYPAGGPWTRLTVGALARGDTVAKVSMPKADEAWLATKDGRILYGTLSSGEWSFTREDRNAGAGSQLNNIAVRADGSGFAVGHGGLILERSGGSWRRHDERPAGNRDLYALELSPADDGSLVGSVRGDVLSVVEGTFRLARRGNPYDANQAHGDATAGGTPLRAIAILPGTRHDQLEVWLGQTRELRRYTSDPDDSVIGRRSTAALPDVPALGPGDLPIATFGSSICFNNIGGERRCPPWQGLPIRNQVILRGIVSDLQRRARNGEGPKFALYTGDITDYAGDHTGFWGFQQAVSDPLARAGLPLFGAVGGADLKSGDPISDLGLPSGAERKVAGSDASMDTWKTAFAGQAIPWGAPRAGRRVQAGEAVDQDAPPSAFTLREVAGPSKTSLVSCDASRENTQPSLQTGEAGSGVELEEQRVCTAPTPSVNGGGDVGEVPPGGPLRLNEVKLAGGGARTHYAFDVLDGAGKQLLRLAVLNTSSGSIAPGAEDNPIEPTSQLTWLDKAICRRGSTQDEAFDCTRGSEIPAVVMTNRPTYTVNGNQSAVLREGASLEQHLIDNAATLLVAGAGRINEKYWVTHASGLHEPRPGSPYPSPGEVPEVARLAAVISSGGGGDLISQDAGRGGWQGYSVVHVPAKTPAGDATSTLVGGVPPPPEEFKPPGEFNEQMEKGRRCLNAGEPPLDQSGARECKGSTVQKDVFVENRPIVDHLLISAKSHVLRAGQNLRHDKGQIRGQAVGPVSLEDPPAYMSLHTGAITHRWDLVMADPDNPSQPLLDDDGDYQHLPSSVATIDHVTGDVTTNRRGPALREWALVLLSVGEKATSYPIAFDPRKSFTPKLPKIAHIPAQVPQVRAAAAGTTPPPAPPQPLGKLGNLELPSLPKLTFNPPPAAQPAPIPPPPPVPPIAPIAAPLEITPAPTSVTVAPPASVIPPPAPPIQPAPPGGARREARQRQAATQKSGATPDEQESGGDNPSHGRIDTAESPNKIVGSTMTRREQARPAPSFTAVSAREQPSAWARGALYGGGLTLMAMVLAAGWVSGRPGPRRRPPEVPAPAWSRYHRRGG